MPAFDAYSTPLLKLEQTAVGKSTVLSTATSYINKPEQLLASCGIQKMQAKF
jgi:hypothetical protein